MCLRKKVLLVLLCGLLTACLGGLIAQAGTQVLLAILRPIVGLDPNSNGLFQQPVIKDRMQAFLGDQYEPVMKLITTADQLQQEGPLYYVVSRYTPIPEIAEKAGFVWNSDTNQMAVMLVTGGSPTVLAEKILVRKAGDVAAEAVPVWPVELQAILDQDALTKKALDTAISHGLGNVDIAPVNVQKSPAQVAEEQLEAELQSDSHWQTKPAVIPQADQP